MSSNDFLLQFESAEEGFFNAPMQDPDLAAIVLDEELFKAILLRFCKQFASKW